MTNTSVQPPASIVAAALAVLLEPDPWQKAALTDTYAEQWKQGSIPAHAPNDAPLAVPDKPARYAKVEVVDATKVRKRGKGGSLTSRQAILHSLAHIESWAIDLSWDIIARFGSQSYPLPDAFFDDFVQVAADECRHFRLLAARLEALGSGYGQLPAHDGLWESAERTAHSLAARLAVEHCVHEARGLDVLPQTVARFRAGGDEESAQLLENIIYPEEVTHCAAGVRWLTHLHTAAHAQVQQEADSQPEGHLELEEQNQTRSTGDGAETGASSAATQGVCISNEVGQAGAVRDGTNGCVGVSVQQVFSRGGGDAGPNGCSDSALQVAQQLSAVQLDNTSTSSQANGVGQENGQPVEHGQCKQEKHEQQHASWENEARQFASVEQWFHYLVRNNFEGALKPPFNDDARRKAGFLPSWYLPLVGKNV